MNLIGIEYKHNGRGQKGIDCLNLVAAFLEQNNINIPISDGKNISKNWYLKNPDRLIEGLQTFAVEVPFEELRPLDILLFEFGGIPRHLGVVTRRGYFLHALEGRKSAVCRINRYRKFLHSCYRVVKK